MKDFLEIAYEMLGVDYLPSDLLMRLIRTEELVMKVKPEGSLHSTQVIASIIADWEAQRA